MLPGRPLADEVRVGDEDPRRPLVGPQHADRLARLDEQRLVVAERAELADDRVEGIPAPGGAPGPAVDHEMVRVLGDLRVEVVHEHPEGRLLLPAATGQLGPRGARTGRGPDMRGAYSRRPATSRSPSCALADRGDRHEDVVAEGDVVRLCAAVAHGDEDVRPSTCRWLVAATPPAGSQAAAS